MSVSIQQLFLSCLLLLFSEKSAAAEFVRLCTLEDSQVIPVTFDEQSGEFFQVNDNNGNKNGTIPSGGSNRLLRTGESSVPSISISTRRIQTRQNVTGKVFYVRKCMCNSHPWDTEIRAYCPIDKQTCGIPRSYQYEPVACFNQSSKTSLIRNAWPVIVLWYGGLIIFLIFTAQGRNARHFVVGKCCNRNLNDYLIEHYWYVEGGFWRRRRRRIHLPGFLQNVRQRDQTRREQEVPPLPPSVLEHVETHSEHPPNQLALKTKRYVAPRNVQDEDDVACTICFSPLEDGDRVGALPCNHCFHVDCLKEWLRRRNICPLCQTPDVASPQYQPRNNDQHVEEAEENSLVEETAEEQPAENEHTRRRQDSSLTANVESSSDEPQIEVASTLQQRRIRPFGVQWEGRILQRR